MSKPKIKLSQGQPKQGEPFPGFQPSPQMADTKSNAPSPSNCLQQKGALGGFSSTVSNSSIHEALLHALGMGNEDLQLLLDVLPEHIRHLIQRHELDELIEVVMDLGRIPEARFAAALGSSVFVELGDRAVTVDDIQHVVQKLGAFTSDNRAGLARTLHRISALRNRQGDIVGLTCRVGKAVTGTIDCIRDLVESGKSILILGTPGVGKTTRLREIAKLLADEARKRVVIVDTSNEIAGDGDIPHPAVGRSRRMQVSSPELQQHVMIEAVENHTPEIIIVDEIGTEAEAMAARTIAERGVILVATAHGSTLENLIKNPMLSDLIGGIQSVTLGDDEAKRRATQKTVLEREKKPTFDIIVELRDRDTLAVYQDVAEAVDHLLRGWTLYPEIRKVDSQTGALMRVLKTEHRAEPPSEETPVFDPVVRFRPDPNASDLRQADIKIFLYAITKGFVERILDRLHLNGRVALTDNIHEAQAALALKGQARPGSKFLKSALDYEIPVFYVKANSMPQIQRSLREALEFIATGEGQSDLGTVWSRLPWDAMGLQNGADEDALEGNETTLALKEAMESVEKVLEEERAVELRPRRSFIRRLQHELVEKYNLSSVSVGDEPNRRLKILPPEGKKGAKFKATVAPVDIADPAMDLPETDLPFFD